MRQKNEDYEELLLMQKAARSAREMAKEEVKRLRAEMRREQEQYDQILTEKRQTLAMKTEARERKEAEEKAKRTAAQGDPSVSEDGDVGSMSQTRDFTAKNYALGVSARFYVFLFHFH